MQASAVIGFSSMHCAAVIGYSSMHCAAVTPLAQMVAASQQPAPAAHQEARLASGTEHMAIDQHLIQPLQELAMGLIMQELALAGQPHLAGFLQAVQGLSRHGVTWEGAGQVHHSKLHSWETFSLPRRLECHNGWVSAAHKALQAIRLSLTQPQLRPRLVLAAQQPVTTRAGVLHPS